MKKTLLFLLFLTSVTCAQWQLRNTGLPQTPAWVMDAYDKNNAAVGMSSGVYITSDAGMSWNKVYPNLVVDIAMVNSNTIYAVIERGVIRTTNGGAKWDTLFQQASNVGMLNYIKVFQNTIITMADCDTSDPTSKAHIYKSTNSGAAWTQVNQNSLTACWSMDVWRKLDFGSSNNGLFYYSINGTSSSHDIMRTTDGGATWHNVSIFPSSYVNTVKMYDKDFGIAQGFASIPGTSNYQGYIFITKNGGASWQAVEKSMTWAESISFIKNKPSDIFIADSRTLFYSADSGKTWSNQNLGVTSTIQDLVFTDENNGWFCTYGGQVYWTENKGNAVVAVNKENKIPINYSLEQNYPNPFNPTTNINFALPEASRVSLKVFDLLGREIKTLADAEMSAGTHSVSWNGDNYAGQKAATGIYLYTLITNKFTQTRKMILLK